MFTYLLLYKLTVLSEPSSLNSTVSVCLSLSVFVYVCVYMCVYVSVCVSDVLVTCVYTAYKARRCLLHSSSHYSQDVFHSSQDIHHSNCLTLCNRASRLLFESVSQLEAAPNSHISKVFVIKLYLHCQSWLQWLQC